MPAPPAPEPTPEPEPTPNPDGDTIIEKSAEQIAFDTMVEDYQPTRQCCGMTGDCKYGYREMWDSSARAYNSIMKFNCPADSQRAVCYKIKMSNWEWTSHTYEWFKQDQTSGAYLGKYSDTLQTCEVDSSNADHTWCYFQLTNDKNTSGYMGAPQGYGYRSYSVYSAADGNCRTGW
jgi:hypothetical protein